MATSTIIIKNGGGKKDAHTCECKSERGRKLSFPVYFWSFPMLLLLLSGHCNDASAMRICFTCKVYLSSYWKFFFYFLMESFAVNGLSSKFPRLFRAEGRSNSIKGENLSWKVFSGCVKDIWKAHSSASKNWWLQVQKVFREACTNPRLHCKRNFRENTIIFF